MLRVELLCLRVRGCLGSACLVGDTMLRVELLCLRVSGGLGSACLVGDTVLRVDLGGSLLGCGGGGIRLCFRFGHHVWLVVGWG